MAHTWRRAALRYKRTDHHILGFVASGNSLVAENDEPEPDAAPDPHLEPVPLPAQDWPDGAARESATEYAQRRASENDLQALYLQLNGSGEKPW
jgi:hypothetical protein